MGLPGNPSQNVMVMFTELDNQINELKSQLEQEIQEFGSELQEFRSELQGLKAERIFEQHNIKATGLPPVHAASGSAQTSLGSSLLLAPLDLCLSRN